MIKKPPGEFGRTRKADADSGPIREPSAELGRIRKPDVEFGRIRKPDADWAQDDEGAAIRTVRTATAFAQSGAKVARRGGQAVRGLLCYAFAALWGFAALMAGIFGDFPSFFGVGAMAAFTFWIGRRQFNKALNAAE